MDMGVGVLVFRVSQKVMREGRVSGRVRCIGMLERKKKKKNKNFSGALRRTIVASRPRDG